MAMTDVRAEFERLLTEMRPKLHRYCARMTGSAVDGEDIVQDAMIKALDALPTVGILVNPAGWLFRIAHNTALDFLRRGAREPITDAAAELDMIAADEPPEHIEEIAVTSLRTFQRLPAAAAAQWAYAAGVVDGRPAMLVFDRKVGIEAPAYFVALTFDGERVAAIHDFLFARYAMDGADLRRFA